MERKNTREISKIEVDLSVVIINWNTTDFLKGCLQSLLDNQDVRLEIIVIDNNSIPKNKNLGFVKELFPESTLILNDSNTGGLANTQARPHCHGKYMLLLGPDTIVKPGCLTTMVNFLNSHSEAGGVSAYLIFPNGDFQRYYNSFPDTFFNLTHFGRIIDRIFCSGRYRKEYYLRDVNFSKIVRVDQPCGACLMIRMSVVDKIGGIVDKEFEFNRGLWFNDVSICKRIYDSGYKIFVHPNAITIHFMHSSFKNTKRFSTFEEFALGSLIYVREFEKSKLKKSLFYLNCLMVFFFADFRNLALGRHVGYASSGIKGISGLKLK